MTGSTPATVLRAHTPSSREADVCLLVEGAYPYVAGGVSGWIHQLLGTHGDLSFHVVALVPGTQQMTARYRLPGNVLSLSHAPLFANERGTLGERAYAELAVQMERSLVSMQTNGGYRDVADMVVLLNDLGGAFGRQDFLESAAAWKLLERMYETVLPGGPFTKYVWSWRSLVGALLGTLLFELPPARVYHAVSTGYAGLLAARARMTTGRPVFVTEHGIYNNERRIEITQADWLAADGSAGAGVHGGARELRDVWVNSFASYTRACYSACATIITLYEGNQLLQMRDGADPDKLEVIPNGIVVAPYAALQARRVSHPPTVAFIGRVVPIKDVKTFIKAAALVKSQLPEARIWALGPADEDAGYAAECRRLAEQLGISDAVEFKGKVQLEGALPDIDVVVLTSLSEAQPLVILEAGAAAIPVVATDVGSCRELIMGASQGVDRFGAGGAVTALAAPEETAREILALLSNSAWRAQCGRALQERVRQKYDKADIDRRYRAVYDRYIRARRSGVLRARERRWRV